MFSPRSRGRGRRAMLLGAALLSFVVATPVAATAAAAKTKSHHKANAKKKTKKKKIKVVKYVLSGSVIASSTTVGQPMAFVGTILPATRRPVRIEFLKNGAWVAGPSTVTSLTTGAYRFPIPTSAVGESSMRVVAPAKPKLKLPALATAVATLSVVTKPVPIVNATPTALVFSPTGAVDMPTIGTPAGVTSGVFAAIYAYPSGQGPDADRMAAIREDIEQASSWFSTVTTGNVQPRWLRSSSADQSISVGTFALSRSTTNFGGSDAFRSIVNELLDARTVGPSEHPVVFVNATAQGLCGQTGRGVTVIFTGGTCPTPSVQDAWPGGSSFMIAHEVTHSFGAALQCAPNDDGSGHVRDDPNDILTAGSASAIPGPVTFDTNRRDYYETGDPTCPGIESSPFWTSTSDPTS